ncbi:hypothetical protein BLA24_21155 [Streptomyces cinnamoneus]|uniref:E9imm peptide n=1 Tax=Streptomyces cinnamoneus TaxID=53446 RepID=A0A2G1XGN7_STRCJ|nr:bacteriocin immunity protein [Streptomyces cinnamoneus]PHQ50400.1 hypothetical protein BLA24_21155 [Streptomyces cinnamoneus]PPT13118.1 hypothetical protein CYQ11_09630 [Streptomyces cinnamoneus]
MTREELIQLVERIMAGEGETEAEHDELVHTLERNVIHPAVTDLIYHTRPELTAEEVVDRALAYKPIAL